MQLIVLGSGSSVPHPKRASSGYWLQTTEGSVLLDCSAAVVHRVAQEGCDWVELDAIWISHFHLDHCGGLPAFLFGTKHAPETQGRTKPLRIFGPAGLRKLIETFDSASKVNQRIYFVNVKGISFEIVISYTKAEQLPHLLKAVESIRFYGQ